MNETAEAVELQRKRALTNSPSGSPRAESSHPSKRPRMDETYYIVNVQHHTYAALLDDTDRLDMVGIKPHEKDTLKPGSKWFITHLERNEYQIQNAEFSSFASYDTRPEARSMILGKWPRPDANPSVWIIKPIPQSQSHYTISPLEDPNLFWSSPSNDDGTPLELDRLWRAKRCQWIFKAVRANTKPSPIIPSDQTPHWMFTQMILERLPNAGPDPIELAFEVATIIRKIAEMPDVKRSLEAVQERIVSTAAQLVIVHNALIDQKTKKPEAETWMAQFRKTLQDEFRKLYQLRDKSHASEILDYDHANKCVADIFERVNEARLQFEQAVGIRVFRSTYQIEGQLRKLFLKELKPSKIANHKYYLEGKEGHLLRRSVCTPGTRVDLLDSIIAWAKDSSPDSPDVYWLFGPAGTGKSTIAYTIARRFEFTGDPNSTVILGGNFFCSRQFEETKLSKHIVPTLAYHLALACKPFADALTESGTFDAIDHDVRTQIQDLLVKPWQESEPARLSDQPSTSHYLVVIDALDEIDGSSGSDFLRNIFDALNEGHLNGLKFFATSRPDSRLVNLVDSFERKQRYRLQDVDKNVVSDDIKMYLTIMLPYFARREEMNMLVTSADGLFIYAATVVKYVEGYERFAQEKLLKRLLAIPNSAIPKRSNENSSGLDRLYFQILTEAFCDLDQDLYEHRLQILHTFLCTPERTSETVAAELLCSPNERDIYVESAFDVLKKLHAVLYTESGRVLSYHKSFSDFLFAQDRSQRFWCDQVMHHRRLTESCFQLMDVGLRFNIANIPSSFILDRDNPTLAASVERNISDVLGYACRNWGHHLRSVGLTEPVLMPRLLSEFLQIRALFWIEAMNLIELLGDCDSILRRASDWARMFDPMLASDVTEVANFVVYFIGSSAFLSTPHLYVSALATWPKNLNPCQEWKAQFVGLPVYTSAFGGGSLPLLNLTLDNEDAANTVAFSHDGTRIAACSDNSVLVWDASTGRELKLLDGNTGAISSVAFSRDGTQIVAASYNGLMKVWDVSTGEELKLLNGHTKVVYSVAFSSDGVRIVSGSGDQSVRVWDASKAEELMVLQAHSDTVYSVAFSGDGTRIVSGSGDHSVRVWDASTGKELHVLDVHGPVNSVAFSYDGMRIVAGSADKPIQMWDALTGKNLKELNGHTGQVNSVAFSSDCTRIVSGSADKSVRVWDTLTGEELKVLRGHSSSIYSVAFSGDGARIVSLSDDRSVRVWDASTVEEFVVLQGHSDAIYSVVFSGDGTRIVSGSGDHSVRVWDASTGEELGVLNGHTEVVNSVALSSDGVRIVSGSGDKSVRLWNASTAEELMVLQAHSDAVYSVAFSGDNTRIVSGSWDHSVRVWDASTGEVLKVLNGHTGWVYSVAFSGDGKQIASGSYDKSVRIWDASTAKELMVLQGHGEAIYSVAFSSDGTRIVSGSEDRSVRVWDSVTGEELQVLDSHGPVNSVAFSYDGMQIVSGSIDQSIRVWDTLTGKNIKVLDVHAFRVESVAFSSDDRRIVSGDDESLRVWDISTKPRYIREHVLDVDGKRTRTGWLLSPSGEGYIMCIPPDGRLPDSCNILTIPRAAAAYVDFTQATLGTRWNECYQP